MKNLYKSKECFSYIFIMIFIILFGRVTFAANGKITGRVIDSQTHEPLPSVNVVIVSTFLSDGREVPLEHPLGAVTSVDGYYFILNVPPGKYAVRASMVGYTTVTQTMVKMELDRTINVNFELTQSSIQVNQVVVTA